ncbi:MAG: DNA primase, partial [Ignavibacteriae bacterium]|nr:DNA primase [Ignavibacteriota bacterium]
MRIPETKIDEVRTASDIVDVIAGYVRLKKRGKNFLGLCPFHQEKTPSFNVSPEKQMYHCFGCGVGGNVFTFVMEHEKVSFVEAVRTLAERAGIALPQESEADYAQATGNEELYNACRAAAQYFSENLVTTIEGKLAFEYFHHRGFSDDTIRTFGLGYSMNSWDGLIRFAEREKLSLETLDRAGLVIKREDGSGYYDRFRGRAMFPIISVTGRTIGFGARKLREDDPIQGKYINSPETEIYHKSRNLYGLYQSRNAIREKEYAILVEGYADLISVFQAGIANIVASSGTALTEGQIELLSRYARNITLVYDADSAGSKATMRGVDLVIENGMEVKVAALPPGDDPDSFVKKHGRDAFLTLLDEAVSFLEFKAKLFQAEGLLDTPEGQARAVRSIVETISRMKDELARNFYIKTLSERYGIYESVLFRELERQLGQERSRARERRESLEGTSSFDGSAPIAARAQLPTVERDLIELMLDHGNRMVGFVFSRIDPDRFTNVRAREVADLILRHAEEGGAWDANTLVNEVEDTDLKRFIADIVFTKYDISKGWAEIDSLPEVPDPFEIAERCLVLLRTQEIDQQISETYRRLKEAEGKGDPTISYIQQVQALQQEKKELRGGTLVKGQ